MGERLGITSEVLPVLLPKVEPGCSGLLEELGELQFFPQQPSIILNGLGKHLNETSSSGWLVCFLPSWDNGQCAPGPCNTQLGKGSCEENLELSPWS